MIDGLRLAAQMKQLGMSQSELARLVGVSQQTIHKLINGASRNSAHLHKIARELSTTPAYLTGETDDPDEGAPPPRPAPAFDFVTMQVALPPREALAEMFDVLLAGFEPQLPRIEQARLLAELLPISLSRLQSLRPVPRPAPSPPKEEAFAGEDASTRHPGPRR